MSQDTLHKIHVCKQYAGDANIVACSTPLPSSQGGLVSGRCQKSYYEIPEPPVHIRTKIKDSEKS